MALLRMKALAAVIFAAALLPALAQEDEVADELVSKPPVAIIFTPPELDGRIVLGIFDATGKLRRTQRYEPGSTDLKIDTNGYVAQWDGRDDAGKLCAGGRYSARGFVIGAEVEVEGVAFHFNDWMAEDKIPAIDVNLARWPDGFGVELKTATGSAFRRIAADGSLTGTLPPSENSAITPTPESAPGRDGTTWMILNLEGRRAVFQLGKDNVALRELRVPADEPQPVGVLASPTEDEILLKETGADGAVRVRMLRRAAAAEEKDGRAVANWEVVFERTLRPCANFTPADFGVKIATQSDSIEIPLVANSLSPVRQKLRLKAEATNPGSALAASDGLELLEVSSDGDWNRFVLTGDGHSATLYQGDGVVVEEFAIRNLDHIAKFDAGAFLLAAPQQ
jgi:hypothetical protein